MALFCSLGGREPQGAGSARTGGGPRTLWLLVSSGQTREAWLHLSESHCLLSRMRI